MILDSRSPLTIFSIVILMLLLVGIWVIGYSISENDRKNDTLKLNVQKWVSNQPSLYRYKVSSGCMWMHSYRIEKTELGLVSTPAEKSPIIKPISIDDLFDEVRKANLMSHKVSIEYHPFFGFPTIINVDWEKEVIDDECFIQVSEFEVLNSSRD